MKDPLLKGHPLHAMLSDVPIGSSVAGLALDLVWLARRDERWRFAATACFGVAAAGGMASALVGLWDYQAVPREHPAHGVGARHGWLNGLALCLLSARLALGAGRAKPWRGALGLAASLGAVGALARSGWLGGELVYRLGWRVTPAEHAEQLEADLRRTGEEERIRRARAIVRDYEQRQALLP